MVQTSECLLGSYLWRFSRQVQVGGDRRVNPEPAGWIKCLIPPPVGAATNFLFEEQYRNTDCDCDSETLLGETVVWNNLPSLLLPHLDPG